ncbi:MAG: 16S rRNA (adenine(1518)-N(6)/adenine(1519)-N(6))-dimethyltransferase RsmA [Prevotellaceae bacterium]|jgi:16S rRNA (adenine1518-N6/adenine1519-N6)-dimethyltransferase|nr:16S rRNA (adenine(1518)-N(6)/adenine(1519)-N(6))-dimethyltransferase RsmA [Prevotellaceae bacterium]
MIEVRAKKRLGQHFLKDMLIARRIVESIGADNRTHVLEIGAGTGALTQFLLNNSNILLKAIEIDAESIGYLHRQFPQLDVIEGDFLRYPIDTLFAGEAFSVIGNFPYNISSQIFFKILQHRNRIPSVVCMLQKEVAERIAAPAGSKVYGITSVLLQTFYRIDYLFTVEAHAFEPPPKVRSAVVRLTRNQIQSLDCDQEQFVRVVKTAFNQRRKMLRNSLKPITADTPLPEPVFDRRPEQLSVAQFVELTKLIEKKLSILTPSV